MTQVERLVIVVDADHERPDIESLTERRYAELSDGRRIEDPRWRSGSISVFSFYGFRTTPEARAAKRRELMEEMIREGKGDRDTRRLESMVSALRAAGVETTPEELRALPIEAEFTDAADARMVDAAAGRLPETTAHAPVPRWASALGVGFWILLGTIFPSLNRYRAWKRQSRPGRVLTFLADWLVGAATSERRRRRGSRSHD